MSVDSVAAALTPRQEEVKARFIEVRGTWSEAWEAVVRLDPDFLEAYLRFSAVPWRHGPLPPKVKETGWSRSISTTSIPASAVT